jgi:hypothetical protein
MSSSSTFQHILNDLVLAIYTLKDNPLFDKSNVTSNKSDGDKNYISSLIKVLKDIGWLDKDNNGRYIRTMKKDIHDSSI